MMEWRVFEDNCFGASFSVEFSEADNMGQLARIKIALPPPHTADPNTLTVAVAEKSYGVDCVATVSVLDSGRLVPFRPLNFGNRITALFEQALGYLNDQDIYWSEFLEGWKRSFAELSDQLANGRAV